MGICPSSWQEACQAPLSFTISLSLFKFTSIESVMLSIYLILCHPLLLLPSIFPSIRVFSNESIICIRWPKVLKFQLQHQSFQWIFWTGFLWDGLVGSPCSPRDSQESSPTPQFEIINSLVLSLLYGPTLIYVHDYWKNYNFHYMNLCQQSDISVMLSLICCLGLS